MTSFPVTVAEWDRNAREVVRVTLNQYQGTYIVDIRNWYRDRDGELKPGRGGITMAARHLPTLAQSLGLALEKARALGLLQPGATDAQ